MGVFDLYSKRQKKLQGDIPEIFVYDKLPQSLRVQIVHIIEDGIGREIDAYESNARRHIESSYEGIHKLLCREYGIFSLINNEASHRLNVLNFFLHTEDVNKAIDVIELCFKYINVVIPTIHGVQNFERRAYVNVLISSKNAIYELNDRFKEHGVGYQYENEANEIIRMDSTYVHEEIVKPSIHLLFNKKFEGACDEYLKAHEHYRHQRNKECISECLKAFESVLKTICKHKKWIVKENATSSTLLNTCFENNLIPQYMQSEFTSLRGVLDSGIAPIRNKLGGHGQGETTTTVSDSITRYALNLTGASIIFLIEQSSL